MKISIFAVGTRGDIQPLVALAKALKSKGVSVLFSTHNQYKDLVSGNSLEYFELPQNPIQVWEMDKKSATERKSLWQQIEPNSIEWLNVGLKVAQGSDALIYNSLFNVGEILGEYLRIPSFRVLFEPILPNGDFPSAFFPIQKNLGKQFNRFTYFIGSQLFWRQIRKGYNQFRRQKLNLPPVDWLGPLHKSIKEMSPFLCAYSSHIVPKTKDWNKNIIVSGYWYLDRLSTFNPPKELVKFLNEGNQPIFFDFGSFSNDKLSKKIKIMLDDIKKSNERLIIDPGKLDRKLYSLPENTFLVDYNIPHEWILTKVKTFITHGGVGAVHAAMRAGVPIIPISIFSAQYFWGKKLYSLNLGTKPVYIKNIKPGSLLNSIDQINNVVELTSNAKKISRLIIDENGAETASNFVMKFLNDKIENRNI